MSTTVTLHHNATPVVITLDTVFEKLIPALPVVSKLFPTNEVAGETVSARSLHTALGMQGDQSTWVRRMIDRFKLIEGVDYVRWQVDPKDMGNWATIQELRDSGKATSDWYLALNKAQHIAALSTTEMGHAVREYLFAVTSAFQKVILADAENRVKVANQEALRQRNLADRNEAVALAAVKKVDSKLNLTQFESAEQVKKRLGMAQERLCDAEGAAFTLWEYSSKARRALSASKPQQALEALQYLDKLYGNYSDLLRDEPPWRNDLQ